jgi:hypothetical protein
MGKPLHRLTILAPGLAACLAAFAAIRAEAQTAPQWRLDRNASSLAVSADGRSLLECVTTAAPMKPYVKSLFTPGGVQILRDSPHDHKHHHGLMFALAAQGVDFWSEKPTCGRQVPRGDVEAKSAGNTATIHQTLDWLAPGDVKLVEEQRTITLHAGVNLPATLLTWRSKLATPEGKAEMKLTGSHYFGLGMRFVESMDKAGRFFNSEGSEGPIVRGSERVTPARWCAYTSSVEGKPVTVAIFDHPRNTRRAYFFTMRPFAYLAATVNLWKEPLELKHPAPLDLRYGVAVCDGAIEPDAVERLYRTWLQREP